jgi:hypothetical protein
MNIELLKKLLVPTLVFAGIVALGKKKSSSSTYDDRDDDRDEDIDDDTDLQKAV